MKKRLRWAIVVIAIILVILVGSYAHMVKVLNALDDQHQIYPGVTVEGFLVGNMTQEEAAAQIAAHFDETYGQEIIKLTYDDATYPLVYRDLGLHVEADQAAAEAYAKGREGSVFSRYRTIKKLEKETADSPENATTDISLELTFDPVAVREAVDRVAADIDQAPQPAAIWYEGGELMVAPGEPGRVVNRNKATEDILNALVAEEKDSVALVVEEEAAPESELDLDRINGLIGEFTTSFSGSTENRKENIRLSTQAFHGKILAPGETLSFNETTGPRSAEAGYQAAGVIVGNKLESGLGGGVCQTSTTLYNAALRADLTIVERRNHTLPVGYVAKGCDGAVSYGSLDLKIKNDFDFPVFIAAYTQGDQVTFRLYGDTQVKDYEVQISSEQVGTVPSPVIEKLDPEAEPGSRTVTEQGRTGLKYATYKTKIRNGEVISSEQITSDYYPATNTTVVVGPPPPPEPETPKEPEQPAEPVAEPSENQEEAVNILP